LASLYKPTPYVVRVYILEGFQLVPKDADGNNPYLKISLGKTKIKDMDTAKQTTSRPQFYKCYEIPVTFPDETMLHIECWDWDPTPPDDLIGSTKIDLETRFYSEEWKAMKYKPIEYRTLWNPTSSNPQGQLKMVEMNLETKL
jgi:Ca2+-dependent lipid-binding protein